MAAGYLPVLVSSALWPCLAALQAEAHAAVCHEALCRSYASGYVYYTQARILTVRARRQRASRQLKINASSYAAHWPKQDLTPRANPLQSFFTPCDEQDIHIQPLSRTLPGKGLAHMLGALLPCIRKMHACKKGMQASYLGGGLRQ